MSLSFKGHTVVVTGAGEGLGKAYCLVFGSRGANVVVNDFNANAAQGGGSAVAQIGSVTDGAAVIKAVVDAFGTVTILVYNAGILRDKGFKNMTDKEWDQIQEVHLKGAFACTKAAWPIFRKQMFDRIVNTASAAGIFGALVLPFLACLRVCSYNYNIFSTAIAPIAASAMTATIMPSEMLEHFKPEYVAPLVALVTHPEGVDANNRAFVLGAGYVSKILWEQVTHFTNPDHPQSMQDGNIIEKLEKTKNMKPNEQATPETRFDGKTALVTGAGAGPGRVYVLMHACLGANVVVNDVSEKDAAAAAVDEVKQAGGKAVAAVCSAEDGEAIVKAALDAFGGVHILIANVDILRDKSYTAMIEAEWDAAIACAKVVWPIFQKQKYGRIVTTPSGDGIYYNSGQTNYTTAKAAIIGLTRTLAIEGAKYNILANAIAPSAGTAMTMTVWPKEMVNAFKPDVVAPVVGYLTSEENETTRGLFKVSGGRAAQVRWQLAGGHGFSIKKALTPEAIKEKWAKITNFDKELQWTFENHEDLSALPTFGVIPQFPASSSLPLDFLPNFNPVKLLHSEQYLSIKGPIPTTAELVNMARLLEVLDQGKAAAGTAIVTTKG
ncbi:unnamed protein product [Peniophora sp. CBMAI 1063]|nr:unnamed protein product [Peniophora sp. CBMAI 1063]